MIKQLMIISVAIACAIPLWRLGDGTATTPKKQRISQAAIKTIQIPSWNGCRDGGRVCLLMYNGIDDEFAWIEMAISTDEARTSSHGAISPVSD